MCVTTAQIQKEIQIQIQKESNNLRQISIRKIVLYIELYINHEILLYYDAGQVNAAWKIDLRHFLK